MDLIVVVIGLVALAIAAMRWGVDSTDGIDSVEWQRRRASSGASWLSAEKEQDHAITS